MQKLRLLHVSSRIFAAMNKITWAILCLFSLSAQAQISIYDGFDDNSNQWIVYTNDTATFDVVNSKLSMSIRYPGHYINAKGAPFNNAKGYRVETSASFESGSDSVHYGICWGASDTRNFMAFYITGGGRYGFGQLKNGIWSDILMPSPSPAINVRGTNWLRVNTTLAEGKRKISLCINELAVRTIDFTQPPGEFFGTYVGGKASILFDDFIFYQRNDTLPEFEPSDLSISASCRNAQYRYNASLLKWSACVPSGCRVDEDSVVTRFWFTDARAGDYSVLVAPFDADSDGDFFNAAQRDFTEYMHDTVDQVTPLAADKPQKTAIGFENSVVVLGQAYASPDLKSKMYIRRYYVPHAFGSHSGLMFQFIVPQYSAYIPVQEELVKTIIGSIEFQK